MDYFKVTENIRYELKKYILDNKIQSLVLGISGGVDSAVCAVLARPVCDDLKIPLIGRSLPILTNKKDEISRAKNVGECFCHDFKEVNCLSRSYRDLEERIHLNENKTNSKIAQGNIKARLRMIYLYNVAGMNNGMVLSTDNLSEHYLAFYTLHGDHNDYGMIQFLWKTEVYGLAEYLANNLNNDRAKKVLRSTIYCVPTDGLGISETDLEQIGANSYEEVDSIFKDYFVSGKKKYCDHPVIQRYERTHWKRNWPITIPRSKLE